MIIVVTGPSGCGKSTLIRQALGRTEGLRFSVSHTTRPPRGSEVDGRDYHFVSPARFQGMIKAGRFLEWAVVHGHHYGTSLKELLDKGRSGDVILDIDIQGALQVRAKFPEADFIFVMPPRFAELKKRLEGRGEDGAEAIACRLERAREEVQAYAGFDFIIINDDPASALERFISVIRGQRCRRERMQAALAPILKSFRRGGRPAAGKKGRPLRRSRPGCVRGR